MALWVVDVRFAPKHDAAPAAPASIACQSGPSSEVPAGSDFEVVVCAERSK